MLLSKKRKIECTMIIFYTGRCYTYFCSWLGSDKRCQQEATGPYDVCFRFGCPCLLSDFATKLSTQRNKTKCIFLSRWRNKEVWYTFLAPLRRLWAVSLLNTSLTYCRSISYHSTSLTDANSKPEGGIWETTSRCEESCHRNEYSRDQVTARLTLAFFGIDNITCTQLFIVHSNPR